jgi:hypothetical protein
MTERVAELLEQVQQLSAEEREEFALAVVARLERESDETEPLDDEVGREAVRRLREVERGEAPTIPAEDVFAELKARLRAKSA